MAPISKGGGDDFAAPRARMKPGDRDTPASANDAALTTTVDLIPAPAFICDRDDGTVRYANTLIEPYMGLPSDEFIGRPVADFYVDPSLRAEFLKRLEKEGVLSGRELTVIADDGTESWINISNRPVVFEGRPAILTVFNDISAVKRAQLASDAERIRASALSDISAILAHGRPNREVYRQISDLVQRLVRFDRFTVALLDPDGSQFTLVFVRGTRIKGWGLGTKHGVEAGLSSHVTQNRTGLVLHSSGPTAVLEKFPSVNKSIDAGLKSFLSAPMIADGRVVGTVDLRSKTDRIYTEADLATIERVAALLAPALEQARLYADLEREARERKTVAEIGRVISSSPDVDSVYHRFAELVREIIPADRVVVSALEDEGQSFVVLHSSGVHTPGREPGQRVPTKGSIIDEVTRTRRPAVIHTVDRDEIARTFPALLPQYDTGVRSFLSLPLFAGDRSVGALHFYSKTVGAYDSHLVMLAESVASEIAGVIANARLRTVERRAARENAALAALGRTLSRAKIEAADLNEAAEIITELLPFDRLAISVIDIERGVFTVVYGFGVEDGGRKVGATLGLEDSICQALIDTRTAFIISSDDPEDLASQYPRLRPGIDAGLRSFLNVPLIVDDRVVATMSYATRKPDSFEESDLQTAERIALQLGPALEKSRLYEELERKSREREIIAEIGRAVGEPLDSSDVFERFTALASKLIPNDRIAVVTLSNDGLHFTDSHASGTHPPEYDLAGYYALDGTVTESVIRDRAPVLFRPASRAEAAKRFSRSATEYDAGMRCFLTAPLISTLGPVGALHFRSKDPDAFTAEHVTLAESIASQIAGVVATNKLRETERREGEVNAALAEISAFSARRRPGNELFEHVADVVGRLVPFDRIGIALLDDDGSRFTLVFVRGIPIKGREQGTVHDVNDSLNLHVAEKWSGLVVDSSDPEVTIGTYPSLKGNLEAGLKSFLTAPMVADDRIVGTMSLRSNTANAYSETELKIVDRVSALLAPALEQSRLYDDLEREAREREIIAEIGRVISASPEIDDVYDRFVDLVRQIIPGDRVAITAMEDDGANFVILHQSGMDAPGRERGQRVSTKGSTINDVTRDSSPILFHPASRTEVEEGYTTLLPLYDVGLRSFLSIPLFVGKRSAGALHFFSKVPNEYDRRHVLLAESVASQIAGIIAISRLRTKELRDAETNATLADIGRIVTSSLDIRPVFDGFAQLVGKVVPFDRLVVTAIDSEAGTATDNHVYGASVPGWGEGTVHQITGSPFEQLLKTRSIHRSDDIATDSDSEVQAREAIAAAGLRSSLMAPLWSNGEVIGSLNLKCYGAGVYTERHVELAARIADQIAGAIANARLYEDVQRVADERRAMAAIALAATRDLDLKGVFSRTADALRQIVSYNRISVTLFDTESGQLKVAFAQGKDLPKFHVGADVTPAPGDPFDGERWTWSSGLEAGQRADSRLPSLVTAALGTRSRHLGYIRLRSETQGVYTLRTVDLLERVASYLTPAIQNALQHQQAIHLVEERERSLLLDQKNRELQQLNEAKSQFLSTVSHELKTPLTSITAFTDILMKNRRGGMTDTDLSQLKIVQRNNQRLGNLIDDLLDLSRLDRGAMGGFNRSSQHLRDGGVSRWVSTS
ncbi:MAG: GAF domain-containing protein, partial [Chloroflexi bacterium]|nr:GAF domain-containing protein [Chloroflexota bacterium]